MEPPHQEYHFTPSSPAHMWEELYKELKSNKFDGVKLVNGQNPINAAILANAPSKVIKLMIEISNKDILLTPGSQSKNITLHFLLGTPTTHQGSKKEIDHSLVRLVLNKAPESFYIKNAKGILPINMITEGNYSELLLIFQDAILNEDREQLNTIFSSMPVFIAEKLLIDGPKFVNKNKGRIPHYRAMILTFEDMKKHLVNLKVKAYDKQAQQTAEELIKQETAEKQKEKKRAEIAERVRLARLEQERKNYAAIQIQKGYRGALQRRKYQEHLKQKGLNLKAAPFIPNKKDPLLDILPTDDEIMHPWKYDNTYSNSENSSYYSQNFAFGSKTTTIKLESLEKDLEILSRL